MAVFILGLSDDPDFLAGLEEIGTQQPRPILEGLVVGLGVVAIDYAPITGDVTSHELPNALSRSLKFFEATWSDQNASRFEESTFHGDHTSGPLLRLMLFDTTRRVQFR